MCGAVKRESFTIASPLGNLRVVLDEDTLVQLDYGVRAAGRKQVLSAYAKTVSKQIQQYFKNPAAGFNLKLDMQGTPFQKRVWRSLLRIPTGQTRTYGQLAKHLNSSARAVGNACRQNPIPLVVPCHRVVAQQGLGGFSGKTSGKPIQRKRWLLCHEGALSS